MRYWSLGTTGIRQKDDRYCVCAVNELGEIIYRATTTTAKDSAPVGRILTGVLGELTVTRENDIENLHKLAERHAEKWTVEHTGTGWWRSPSVFDGTLQWRAEGKPNRPACSDQSYNQFNKLKPRTRILRLSQFGLTRKPRRKKEDGYDYTPTSDDCGKWEVKYNGMEESIEHLPIGSLLAAFVSFHSGETEYAYLKIGSILWVPNSDQRPSIMPAALAPAPAPKATTSEPFLSPGTTNGVSTHPRHFLEVASNMGIPTPQKPVPQQPVTLPTVQQTGAPKEGVPFKLGTGQMVVLLGGTLYPYGGGASPAPAQATSMTQGQRPAKDLASVEAKRAAFFREDLALAIWLAIQDPGAVDGATVVKLERQERQDGKAVQAVQFKSNTRGPIAGGQGEFMLLMSVSADATQPTAGTWPGVWAVMRRAPVGLVNEGDPAVTVLPGKFEASVGYKARALKLGNGLTFSGNIVALGTKGEPFLAE